MRSIQRNLPWSFLLGIAALGIGYAVTRTRHVRQETSTAAHQPGLTFQPTTATGNIGDMVSLLARPQLPSDTAWVASCDGPLSFLSHRQKNGVVQIAPGATSAKAEVLIQPWEPVARVSFIRVRNGPTESRSATLKIQPLPYRELAPVRMDRVASNLPPGLTYSRSPSEVIVHYVRASHLGPGWKRALLAETKKPLGRIVIAEADREERQLEGPPDLNSYSERLPELRLSYPASVPPPVRVLIIDYGTLDCSVRVSELTVTK